MMNAEKTWNDGAKVYAKLWKEWSIEGVGSGAGSDEAVDPMSGQ